MKTVNRLIFMMLLGFFLLGSIFGNKNSKFEKVTFKKEEGVNFISKIDFLYNYFIHLRANNW